MAELTGTAFLLAAVIGSGIMATRLTGDVGLQLLINAVATAGALVALLLALGPVSGAHLNPAVTLAMLASGALPRSETPLYIGAQVAGACAGVVVANLMFGLPAINTATVDRSGGGLLLGESVATLGLLLVVFGVVRSAPRQWIPVAVAAYIGAAYFFTSSTSFANPAVTLARTLSDSFAGIAPASVPAFLVAQAAGLVAALGLIRLLFPAPDTIAAELPRPYEEDPTR
ncbi:aquaporin [Rhabdothermincola sp.]|uniref:aquaporin n=1 Tax=Rhabdothermincola sp. TaxID=2820405 RepID=UPI003FA6DEBC